MKKIEKSLSIGSCINYSAQIFILLYGMMLLLTSCDAVELPDDNPAVNEMIQVFINPLEIKEGSSEDLTRASGMLREPETMVAPLGDGLLLEMTLEPVPASPTRATTTLGNGKKFRVIALDSNNKYVSHADFTAGSGSNTDSAFHLPSGKTYTFICVSLNSTTALPATANLSAGHTPSFSAAAGTDLLYGSITRRVDTQNDATLSFVLSHKFSEITVMADCRYNAWSIQTIQANSIRLGSVYAATMSYDGRVSVSGNAVTNRYFLWNSPMTAATTQKSLTDVVYTGAANLTLVVSKGAVETDNGIFPSSETEVTFTGVTLEQGKRYTLNLKIKTPKFAASNIYWNGQALTFDEYEKTPHAVKQEKQGVLFKWGSLIGLSVAWVPLKPNNPSTFPQWNANRAVYVPDSNTANPTWTKMAAGSTYSDWHNIPFVQGLDSKYGGVRSRYLTAMGADSVAFYKGDICQYLNSDYRMPSGGELGSYTSQQATEDAYSFFMSSTPVRYTYEEGKFLIANGATLKINSFYFPASGYRSLIDPSNPNQTPYGDGEFVNVHEGGYYWSSSPENDSRANLLTFGYQLTTRLTNEGRGNACSVRCVKKN